MWGGVPGESGSSSYERPRRPGMLTLSWGGVVCAIAVLGWAVGLLIGFFPVTVRSSTGQPINCGSAFIEATINVLLADQDGLNAPAAGSGEASSDVVGMCDSLRGRNRGIAVTSLAVGVAATFAVALRRKWSAGEP